MKTFHPPAWSWACALVLTGLAGCGGMPSAPSGATPPPRPDPSQTLVVPPAPASSLSIIEGNAWTGQMVATAKTAQQAALTEGEIEVQRTADNRLLIRIPTDAAFDLRSGRPKARLTRYCQALADVLIARPQLLLDVAAYATGPGADGAANLRRLEQQAQSLKQLLVQTGLPSTTIRLAGRGSSQLGGEDLDALAVSGAAAGRRVELLISHPVTAMSSGQ